MLRIFLILGPSVKKWGTGDFCGITRQLKPCSIEGTLKSGKLQVGRHFILTLKPSSIEGTLKSGKLQVRKAFYPNIKAKQYRGYPQVWKVSG